MGLRLVRTPWSVLMNADITVSAGWLEELYANKDAAEKAGHKVGLVGHQARVEPGKFKWLVTKKGTPDIDYVTGHCYLLNMQALEEVSAARGTPGWYFNEQDPAQIQYKADVHMCYDLNALGWATIACFNNTVYHHHGGCQRSGWDPKKVKLADVNDLY